MCDMGLEDRLIFYFLSCAKIGGRHLYTSTSNLETDPEMSCLFSIENK